MNRILVLTFILFIAISCNNSKSTSTELAPIRIDSVFNFAQTSDSKFCNKDSVMHTDCGLGTLYLTRNGNAIYHYYCLGDDTTTYCIGTYVITDSGITCNYTKDYLYADCEQCEEADSTYKVQEPENGTLRTEKHNIMQLIKAKCNDFDFYIPPTEEQKQKTLREFEQAKTIGYTLQPFRGYVFWKATEQESKDVRSLIKKISALADL